MRNLITWVTWILGLCFLVVGSAGAQTTPAVSAILSPPAAQDFPLLQPMLKVFTPQGGFLHGLSQADVQLYENGIAIPLQEVREQRVGVQVVFVINPGGIFLVRDAQGFTRYDYLMDGLVDWARRRLGSTIDDLSIVVTDGPTRSHLNNPLELFYTLASYRLPEDAVPTLDTLLKGIEIASDPTPRHGMEQVVFFITAPLGSDQTIGIQNAIQQAQQNGVRIYIWLLTTTATPNPQDVESLKLLAEETGGKLWVLAQPQDQPDPEITLEPLRSVYTLRYSASAASGNERQLEAEVKIGQEVIRTQPIVFRIDLQPPNIVFLSPPAEILRQPAESTISEAGSSDIFEPKNWRLNLLIEFPDGRPRSIVKMRVYVDDQLILEQLQPPFDTFVWDLRGYTQSEQHTLQVEVVDELGMSAKTITTPILIKVSRPALSPSRMIERNIPLMILSITLFAFASLVLILTMRGQLLPTSLRLSRRLGMRKKQPIDPLTQPVLIPPLEPPKRSTIPPSERQTSLSTQTKPRIFARLYRLDTSEGEPSGPIAMIHEELTVGRNATRNALVIDDPSVESVHARLLRQPDGRIRICDLGSLMGTWVNYTPVSQEGVILEDGDLIHFGRVGFRFRLRQTKQDDAFILPKDTKP